MKKVTLIFLILFAIAVTGIFIQSGQNANMANSSTTSIQNSTTTSVFTITEVSKHNTSEDCYLIINNNVYNVSSYIGSHPGGRSAIISHCGEEVSDIFASIHSNRAWGLLSAYKIGVYR